MPIDWLSLFEGLFSVGEAVLPELNKKGKKLKEWDESTYGTSFYSDDATELKEGELQLLKSIVTEQSIEEGSFYRDSSIEESIKDKLLTNHLCVISGAEGRGKSVLSQLIAYDFHKKGWEVFITKENWRTDYLKSSVHDFQGIRSDHKCLFVLEDVHLLSEADLQKLFNTIEEIYIPKENLYFLMNMRPSLVKEDLIDMEDSLIELNDSDNSEFIRHLAALINKEPETLKINGKPVLDASQAGNRRMLFYFFKELQKEGVDSVKEEDILTKFSTAYLLDNDCSEELLFLSSLYQFEIPLPEAFLDRGSRAAINKYANLGLCRKLGRFYYMPETTDARCLCKAICKRNMEDYTLTTIDQIKLYYNKILESKNPSAFENDFRNLFTYLLKEDDFSDLISYFKEPEVAKKIITDIYPGFILYALAFRPTHKMPQAEIGERLAIYSETKVSLMNNLTRIDPLVLNTLRYTLKNYYGFPDDDEHGLVKDLFPDHDSVVRYFSSGKKPKYFNSVFKRRLKNISRETEEYLASIQHISLDSYQDYLHYSTRNDNKKRHGYKINHKLSKHSLYLITHGLYVLNQTTIDSGDYDNYLISAQLFATRMLNPDILSIASAERLSLFLKNLGFIDKGIYDEFLQEELIQEDAKERIANFGFTESEFYLLSHYYKPENVELTEMIDRVLSNTTTQQQGEMRKWLEKISHCKPFNEGSLASATERALMDLSNKS